MAEAIEYVNRLADTIGARPAGTEEEQQASFFIEEVLRDQAGLPTETEEFNCNLNFELPRAICCIATAVLGILSLFLPLMVVPSVIICLVTAVLFITDAFGRSAFTKIGNSGISQNVLARYTPPADPSTRGRKRKVILMAHYDSGKVRAETKGALLNALPVLYILEVVGMALVPFALLIRFATSATAGLLMFLNILTVVGVVFVLVPVIGFIMHQTAQYNKGANVNASGIAVLLECAQRVQEEPEDIAEDIVMHGEEELRQRGLVPEGADLVYEETPASDGGDVEQVRLDTVGIDPVTGERVVHTDTVVADGPAVTEMGAVDVVSGTGAMAGAPEMAATVSTAGDAMGASVVDQRAAYSAAVSGAIQAPEPEPEEDPNVPEWYRTAMRRANKHEETTAAPVQRSRFADALDNANAVSAHAIEHEEAQSEAERRLAQMRASIMGEAGAPGVATAHAASGHHHAGVDGYLSSMTDTASYEVASMGERANMTAVPASSPDPSAVGATAVGAASAVQVGAVADVDAAVVAEAAREAAAVAAAAASKADKTISFIPVEVDTDAMRAENDALKQASTSAVGDAAVASEAATGHARKKRTISLPSLTGAIEGVNARLQDAPLSDQEELSAEDKNARRHARQEALAASLPMTDSQELPERNQASVLDGQAQTTDAAQSGHASDDSESVVAADRTQAINTAGAFVSASATSTFEPVGEELIADMDAEDVYIEDADDSDYASEFTASGAPAGAGYVEMPKSRASRMFGRFRRKKHEEDLSMSEAYGLDDSWDARSAGAARGGWESFRSSDDRTDAFDEEDDWNGGAFSKVRAKVSRGGRGQEASDDAYADEAYEGTTPAGRGRGHAERSSEDVAARRARRLQNPFGDLPLTPSAQLDERELIQQFKNGAVSCEVWFLAVGAELANNAGIRAFMNAHADELRGAIVIDLDGLGAGHLSLIEEDGIFQVKKPAARLKRYVNKASSALGMKLGHGKMRWRNSGAWFTAQAGLQTLHLAGMAAGKPAFAAQADDVIDNISEEALRENTAFVMEILRQI